MNEPINQSATQSMSRSEIAGLYVIRLHLSLNSLFYQNPLIIFVPMQDGTFHVNRPSPKFVSAAHASSSGTGAIAPMTGTIVKVSSNCFNFELTLTYS